MLSVLKIIKNKKIQTKKLLDLTRISRELKNLTLQRINNPMNKWASKLNR
jgi:hypothetical protein